eukprot:GEMP01069802.1.p1 GENE.GEMP01069802.1~~GEMP01069802.1.p1  ORF type:complete len:107 (-),score=4.30 GEMP01069802.1:298-618(-)
MVIFVNLLVIFCQFHKNRHHKFFLWVQKKKQPAQKQHKLRPRASLLRYTGMFGQNKIDTHVGNWRRYTILKNKTGFYGEREKTSPSRVNFNDVPKKCDRIIYPDMI